MEWDLLVHCQLQSVGSSHLSCRTPAAGCSVPSWVLRGLLPLVQGSRAVGTWLGAAGRDLESSQASRTRSQDIGREEPWARAEPQGCACSRTRRGFTSPLQLVVGASPAPRQLPSLSSEPCLSQSPWGLSCLSGEEGRRLKAASCRAVPGKALRGAVTAGIAAPCSRHGRDVLGRDQREGLGTPGWAADASTGHRFPKGCSKPQGGWCGVRCCMGVFRMVNVQAGGASSILLPFAARTGSLLLPSVIPHSLHHSSLSPPFLIPSITPRSLQAAGS